MIIKIFSASLNGCRDLITLSTANSNYDLKMNIENLDNIGIKEPIGSRPSIFSTTSSITNTNIEVNSILRNSPSPSSMKLSLRKSNS